MTAFSLLQEAKVVEGIPIARTPSLFLVAGIAVPTCLRLRREGRGRLEERMPGLQHCRGPQLWRARLRRACWRFL